MQLGLVGFLKHVALFTRFSKLYISQKSDMAVSLISELKSPNRIILSYLDRYLFRIFSMSFINVEIFRVYG